MAGWQRRGPCSRRTVSPPNTGKDRTVAPNAADNHIIGLHSDTHPTAMAKLPTADQQMEYTVNFLYLKELLGEAPLAMSHPCDSYNENTLSVLRKLGIKLGFRAVPFPLENQSMLEMPREDHASLVTMLTD